MNSTNGFNHDDLLDAMEYKLSDLASMWRGQQQTEDAEKIVRQYQAVLRCMIELGFHDELDIDSELPDELMPTEYLDLFQS
jgi:hypothetical protein